MAPLTLLDIIVRVVRLELVALVEPSEGVDDVRAQVRVDVLRRELGERWPVDGPVGVVADDLQVGPRRPFFYRICEPSRYHDVREQHNHTTGQE